MEHKTQNEQIELLSKLALSGGGYSWNSFPISDSSAEDPDFYISQPMEPLRREMLAAARRRDSGLLAEPHIETEENAGAAPRTPYRVPAGIVPHEEGEGLSLTNPRPDRFKNFAGSGEGAKLLRQLDALSRRMLRRKKKSRDDERAPHGRSRVTGYIGTEGVQREAEDQPERGGGEEWMAERDRVVKARPMAGDRTAAMDVTGAMPLDNEQLHAWHKWVYKYIDQFTPHVRPHLEELKRFLRTRGLKQFGALDWREKRELREIVERIASADA